MDTKEEMLRREVQALRELLVNIVQWSVSVLIAVQTALFFVRREVMHSLVERQMVPGMGTREAILELIKGHKLAPDGLLPLIRYFAGTFFLFTVACVFAALTIYTSNVYRHYKDQLVLHTSSGVTEPATHKTPRRLVIAMYLFFPLFDAAARLFLPHV